MKLQQSVSQVESALFKKPRGKGLKGLHSDLKAPYLDLSAMHLKASKKPLAQPQRTQLLLEYP